ncbi:hypothetical protein BDQ17DRAFT_1421344 [Cyathus striatus]|nr:hypothetical protein BDQ17DRAFT_1421344 [Cyathus striatus]
MVFATFAPTENERSLAAYILKFTNSDKLGHMPGDLAVDVFQRTGLPVTVLSDIWNIADKDNDGSISENELAIAIRLMGWAQSGEIVTRKLIEKAGPLPRFEGIPDQDQSNSSDSPGFLPLHLKIVMCFVESFSRQVLRTACSTAINVLSEIWNLVDSEERGALDITNFALGMYLIQALKTCQISTVPTSIPSEIYDQLVDLASPDISLPTPSTSKALTSPWPSSSAKSNQLAREDAFQSYNQTWDVTSEEKREARRYFNTLCASGEEYVDGEEAAKFLMKFKLPAEDVARIWDLVDINHDNRLTRESFTVAIHLVHQRLSGGELPYVLPPSLIPPTMRPPLTAPIPHASLSYCDNMPQRHRRGSSPGQLLSKSSAPRLRRSGTTLPQYSRYPQQKSMSVPSVFDMPEEPIEANGTSKAANRLSLKSPLSPTVDNVFFEELKGETKSLRLQVEQLMKQLSRQNDSHEQNVKLTEENGELKAKMRDIEQAMSQVLAANQRQDSTEGELMEEISRLTIRIGSLEHVEVELAESSRMLVQATQDNEDLKARMHDTEAAGNAVKEAAEGLQKTVDSLQEENRELKQCVSDMERSLAEPDTRASRRELRVLLKDITRENDSLKRRVREMEQSMTQMLLTNNDHAHHEELANENKRLTLHAREMEAFANQLQSSSQDNVLQRFLEDSARENDRLKSQLREVQQVNSEQLSRYDDRVRDLEGRLNRLTQENQLLATQRTGFVRHSDHDPAIPPPAYDDTIAVA